MPRLPPPLRAPFALLPVAALALSGPGCLNECRYFEQCADDSTLLQCGEGVDHVAGRKEKEVPCDALNPVCVAPDEDHAACVAAEGCAEEGARCEGTVLVTCGDATTVFHATLEGMYEQRVDCADFGEGYACLEEAEGPRCGTTGA
jgi:hypothetical protein